jgi:hypothetical protein
MVSWQGLTLNRRGQKGLRTTERARAFRPSVSELENRTAPAGLGDLVSSFSNLLQSGPATHLRVVTPEKVQAGKSFDVFVAAETASNRVATSYRGTVHFSLTAADAGAKLPLDYTFKASDRGVHVFHVTLSTAGGQTLSVTDTTTASITDSASFTVNAAPVASQFVVRMPDHVTAGKPTFVTVAATDSSGRPVSNYTGKVQFASSDSAATLPQEYTFTAADRGVHTFQVTMATAGSQTVTVTDTAANSTVKGTATTNVEAVGAATHFAVKTLGIALAGSPTPVQIVALDASNRVVTNYTGTIHFTSSDSGATLPADYKFTAEDKGVHLFYVTFAKSGRHSVTATDLSASALMGAGDVLVLSQLGGRRSRWF